VDALAPAPWSSFLGEGSNRLCAEIGDSSPRADGVKTKGPRSIAFVPLVYRGFSFDALPDEASSVSVGCRRDMIV
jgi:hypothetical protein